jgi:hypothetical protein
LPEANRAEGNVVERRAAAARNPRAPKYKCPSAYCVLATVKSLHHWQCAERPTGEARAWNIIFKYNWIFHLHKNSSLSSIIKLFFGSASSL